MLIETRDLSRRQILKASVLGTAGLIASGSFARVLAGEPTPAQTEGPFHPTQLAQDGSTVDLRTLQYLDEDSDLTFVSDNGGTAQGQVLYVFGTVRDEGDNAVANATVEIWQACYSGKYDHQDDASSNPIDPNFQYWGFATTDANGKYTFKTILPGAYRNDPTWIRPPHIHYKVRKPGWNELTTQLYFTGIPIYFEGKTYSEKTLDRLNAKDQVLVEVPSDQRSLVIAKVLDPTADMTGLAAGAKFCTFDIVLPS